MENCTINYYKKENISKLREEMSRKGFDAYIIPHSDKHDVK
jgi:hypothetical protein